MIFAWLEQDGERYKDKVILSDGKHILNEFYYFKTGEKIINHSKNIIDLIEEGDIVKVKDILYDTEYISEVFKSYEDDLCINNFEVSEIIPIRKFINENQINIKSIVTKEQIETLEYKVGG